MPDITEKTIMPHQWIGVEIAENVRVGVWSDAPMTRDALARLLSILSSMKTQMDKGVLPNG